MFARCRRRPTRLTSSHCVQSTGWLILRRDLALRSTAQTSTCTRVWWSLDNTDSSQKVEHTVETRHSPSTASLDHATRRLAAPDPGGDEAPQDARTKPGHGTVDAAGDRCRVSSVLLELSDSLVADFDVINHLRLLADRTVDLLGVPAAAVMLAGHPHTPAEIGASRGGSRLHLLLTGAPREGPWWDCIRFGTAPANVDLGDGHQRWRRVAPQIQTMGYPLVTSLPMTLRHQGIGSITCFHTTTLDEVAVRLGQALCDAATIAILQSRATDRARQLTAQHHTEPCTPLPAQTDGAVGLAHATRLLADAAATRQRAVHAAREAAAAQARAMIAAEDTARARVSTAHRLNRPFREEIVAEVDPSVGTG
jgi:hypothetical protein